MQSPRRANTSVLLCIMVIAMTAGRSDLRADFIFGEPENLGPPVNSAYDEGAFTLSVDGLTMYFCSNRPGGLGDNDLYETTRATLEDQWSEPVNLGPAINTNRSEGFCTISTDGLTLIFSEVPPGAARSGGFGGRADLWVSQRATKSSPWAPAENLGGTVNSNADDMGPNLSADGLSLFFMSTRSGSSGRADVWVTERQDLFSPWEDPFRLGSPINGGSVDGPPAISRDGLIFFFGSMRSGGMGNYDVWMTTRSSVNAPWDTPQNLGPSINTSTTDGLAFLCVPQKALFFASERPGMGGFDIWQAPIAPVKALPDLNGDSHIDWIDFSILLQCWQQADELCDISPAPNGDGVVDAQDIAGLFEYWLYEIGLVAHWSLDETEGYTAHDSAGDHDALVIGPLWRPTDGIVNGALEFDGVDDYVSTPFVLDPADETFSVFVWIKGGVAGQAVLSQIGAADWLLAHPTTGGLMTELKSSGRFGQPLISDAVITDGNWHRVGLTWDGSNRILYVDDVEAAKDTQSSLTGSQAGLYIGAGKDREPGSFFSGSGSALRRDESGLIDDVRIYDRAIVP